MSNITGKIKVIYPAQQVSEKFKKRDFVIADLSSQYVQYITFQLAQDRCSIIDGLNEGDEVRVHYNLRGREWTKDGETKYFNTIEAWKVEKVVYSGSNPQQSQQP